jgi:hypothetical protein
LVHEFYLRGIIQARISAAGHPTGIAFRQMTRPRHSTWRDMPITVGRMYAAISPSMIASQNSQLSATAAGITGPPLPCRSAVWGQGAGAEPGRSAVVGVVEVETASGVPFGSLVAVGRVRICCAGTQRGSSGQKVRDRAVPNAMDFSVIGIRNAVLGEA